MMRALLLTIVLLTALYDRFVDRVEAHNNEQQQQQQRPHNNYAIIVSTSRYWFNYRHHTNALLIYQYIKSYGNYTDDHIILMLADEYNVNPRNPIKNHVYNTATDSVMKDRRSSHNPPQQPSTSSLYTDDIEIDYRGEDVNVENFMNALMGRQPSNTNHHTLRPVLQTNEDSHILIYMTGHGGDLFLKFQDNEEITSLQFAEMFQYMHQHDKYREILFIADTCQAFTLGDHIISRQVPNVYVVGTSLRGESSYAHIGHPIIGVSVVEKYTHYMMEYVTSKQHQQKQQQLPLSALTLSQMLIEPFNTSKQTNMLHANVGMDDSTSLQRKLQDVPWDDFFVQPPPSRAVAHVPSSIRVLPMNIETPPLMIATSSSSSCSQPNCHDDRIASDETVTTPAALLVTTQCDSNDNDFEIITIEPDHPIFILLVVTTLALVVVGSHFY